MLLLSGFYLTKSHTALLARDRFAKTNNLVITIVLGCLFSGVQLLEYRTATFSINDGVYGSIFYMLTGFHGLHVLIGNVFLLVCLARFIA
jgi:cytochrome c oxidase subunit 3